MEKSKGPILLYTDGACSGNPGPGGYAAILRYGEYEKEFSGGFRLTTNNRMELLAVITGLEAIRWRRAKVEIYSDSAYVVNAVTKGWLEKWVRSDFAKKKNEDLWRRYMAAVSAHDVTFHWIKGHAGHPENERCDALAVEAASREALPEDKGYIQ